MHYKQSQLKSLHLMSSAVLENLADGTKPFNLHCSSFLFSRSIERWSSNKKPFDTQNRWIIIWMEIMLAQMCQFPQCLIQGQVYADSLLERAGGACICFWKRVRERIYIWFYMWYKWSEPRAQALVLFAYRSFIKSSEESQDSSTDSERGLSTLCCALWSRPIIQRPISKIFYGHSNANS